MKYHTCLIVTLLLSCCLFSCQETSDPSTKNAATTESVTATVTNRATIHAPANDVWNTLAAIDKINTFLSVIDTTSVEGSGEGAVRSFTTHDGTTFREVITRLDAENKTLVFRSKEATQDIRSYETTIQVKSTAAQTCDVHWETTFTANGGFEQAVKQGMHFLQKEGLFGLKTLHMANDGAVATFQEASKEELWEFFADPKKMQELMPQYKDCRDEQNQRVCTDYNDIPTVYTFSELNHDMMVMTYTTDTGDDQETSPVAGYETRIKVYTDELGQNSIDWSFVFRLTTDELSEEDAADYFLSEAQGALVRLAEQLAEKYADPL